MSDVPEIVEELRREEALGKLTSKIRQSYNDFTYSDGTYGDPSRRMQAHEEATNKGNTVQVNIDYERKLLEAEERYEKIFRLSPDAIVLLDRNGVLVDMNERLHDWLGYRPEEVIGKNILELPFLSVDEKVKVKHYFLLRISGKEVPPYELWFITKQGDKRIGLVRGVPIKDEYRNVIQSLVMVSDITERKKFERTMHQTVQQLKELEFIVNHSGAVAFLWRAEESWPVEFVSENIIQFGYTKEELLSGKVPYTTLIHMDDVNRVKTEVTQYTSDGFKEFIQEYRIRTKTGEVRWVDDRTWIRRDETGAATHYQGIILDITKRKEAEEELKRAHEQLSELNEKLQQKIITNTLQHHKKSCTP